ncbi:hypothetical protein AGRA3207_002621 [Actinomadura graeca]|uniref:Uncharacterized protein n=1 Tax=Actinomadura graeca TaxID=2750812 RepID=A0ABX8QSN2_9ACTN|nr:hypothetical protein [Actinomadura graeca]QXJ21735.1 hypothetical protein AGRA3207_002621 [Actinomadura graeca]
MVTFTSRPGQLTDPMSAERGRVDAGGLGERDGLPFVGVGEAPEGAGLGDVGVGVADVDALDSDDVAFISAGTAISAAMTKNTAAMTTLGNCIAFLPGPLRG